MTVLAALAIRHVPDVGRDALIAVRNRTHRRNVRIPRRIRDGDRAGWMRRRTGDDQKISERVIRRKSCRYVGTRSLVAIDVLLQQLNTTRHHRARENRDIRIGPAYRHHRIRRVERESRLARCDGIGSVCYAAEGIGGMKTDKPYDRHVCLMGAE